MAIVNINLTKKQVEDLLFYETGFEQMHPNIESIRWMEEQGWKYRKHWDCQRTHQLGQQYTLIFTTEAMASTFMLRWA